MCVQVYLILITINYYKNQLHLYPQYKVLNVKTLFISQVKLDNKFDFKKPHYLRM